MGLGAPMAWLLCLLGTDVDRDRQMGQTQAADSFSDLRITAECSSFQPCLSFSKIWENMPPKYAFNFD